MRGLRRAHFPMTPFPMPSVRSKPQRVVPCSSHSFRILSTNIYAPPFFRLLTTAGKGLYWQGRPLPPGRRCFLSRLTSIAGPKRRSFWQRAIPCCLWLTLWTLLRCSHSSWRKSESSRPGEAAPSLGPSLSRCGRWIFDYGKLASLPLTVVPA